MSWLAIRSARVSLKAGDLRDAGGCLERLGAGAPSPAQVTLSRVASAAPSSVMGLGAPPMRLLRAGLPLGARRPRGPERRLLLSPKLHPPPHSPPPATLPPSP